MFSLLGVYTLNPDSTKLGELQEVLFFDADSYPCSTPFGITEFGTQNNITVTPALVGAQRLSASLSSAPE